MIAVLDETACRVRAARTEVDREHRFDIGGPAPVDKFVSAERIGFGRHPGEIESARTLVDRPDTIFPVVAGDEIAARIPHDRGRELAHQCENICAIAFFIRRGMAWLVDAAIDAAAEVLDEGAEEPPVGHADGIVTIEFHGGVGHAHGSRGWADVVVTGANGLPASSGASTDSLR